jgi:hypothetical protein
MEKRTLSERVHASLPSLDELRERVRGDADLELVLGRIEQVETLLVDLAKAKSAVDRMERAAAEAKVARAREDLTGTTPRRERKEQEETQWNPRSDRPRGKSGAR